MKQHGFLWALLILGLGSVLLLVRLQHLTENMLQENSDVPVLSAASWGVIKESPFTLKLHGLHPGSSPLTRPSSGSSHTNKHHQRKLQLTDVCSRHQLASDRVTRQHVSQVFVEDRFRLLYCEVPKAGCSNWKRVLMVLGGRAHSTQDISHNVVHYSNHLQRLDSYNWTGAAERLRSYTKVLFVREPFQRLVSAFRDKFENPNSYYHRVFGRAIISRYRANASGSALMSGAGVTFPEFIQYLLDENRPVGMDVHWKPISQLCSPCLLHYSFIGKFESLEEDANFLLRSIVAPPNLTFPTFKDRNPLAERTSSRMMREYFSQLNSTERQKTFDFYCMDYMMFGYPKPFSDLYCEPGWGNVPDQDKNLTKL